MADKTKREKIVPCILAAVVNNNKILMIHRTKEPYKGYWSMTGGKIEFGEHIEETAAREVFEETGLKCKVEAIKGIATEIVHNDKEAEQHFLMFIVQLRPETTELVESKEGELGWYTPKELENMKVTPSDLLMIKEFVLNDRPMKVHRIKVKREGEIYDVEEFI